MSGIVVFIYALIDYIEVCLDSNRIRLSFSKQFGSNRYNYNQPQSVKAAV